MLYVNTRNTCDINTPNHPLIRNKCDRGGMYVPYRLPILTKSQLSELVRQSAAERIVAVLRLFFRLELSPSDVENALGIYPIQIAAMNHRIAVTENWHNPSGSFTGAVESLYKIAVANSNGQIKSTIWFRIAVRLAYFVSAFCELIKAGITHTGKPTDVALQSNSFETVMAAWYARKMGLPIANIILSCCENSGVWDLLHHGELPMRGYAASVNLTEDDSSIPACLEMLIYEVLGSREVERFVAALSSQTVYCIRDEQLAALKTGMYCAVVRRGRVESIIRNVQSTNSYLMETRTAIAFGGLQDYRATKGETGAALICADESP